MSKDDKIIITLMITFITFVIVCAVVFDRMESDCERYKSLYKEAVARYPKEWMALEDVNNLIMAERENFAKIIACQSKYIEQLREKINCKEEK